MSFKNQVNINLRSRSIERDTDLAASTVINPFLQRSISVASAELERFDENIKKFL
jgi:hypothetical protein